MAVAETGVDEAALAAQWAQTARRSLAFNGRQWCTRQDVPYRGGMDTFWNPCPAALAEMSVQRFLRAMRVPVTVELVQRVVFLGRADLFVAAQDGE